MIEKGSICCIFNFPPHYRASIYQMMDADLSCEFYFGDKVDTQIRMMDLRLLKGNKGTVRNIRIFGTWFWWQKSVVHLVFKRQYKHFVLTGDSSIVSNWVILFLCRLLNKHSYIWMHGLQSSPSWKGKLLTYPFYWMANKFLLYGEYAQNIMIDLGFSANKMICIYNSLDYEKQLMLRKNLRKSEIYLNHFSNNLPNVVYIGRIQKIKKLDILFESMSFLEKRGRICNLVIIGDNTDNIDLQELHSRNKLNMKYWDYGSCYDERTVSELLFNADVCVSPGNIGLTAVHAMTYGTPCITHNKFSKQMPEFEAIQCGRTGDFFEENSAEDLSFKIESWISLSEVEREDIRGECYSVIDQKYNPKVQIALLRKVFCQ